MMSSERSHSRIESLLAAQALGGLNEADRERLQRTMASHGAACEVCRRLAREYEEAAAHLALALDPIPLSAGAEERLMAAVHDHASERAERVTTLPRGRRWLVPLAVAAVAAAVAGFAGYQLAPRATDTSSAVLAFLSRPGTQVVTFPGTNRQQLAVAYHPDRGTALVFGRGLATPPPGKVYELWYRTSDSPAMKPAGTFVPDDGIVNASASIGPSITALAVSVEPAGGSLHPTTEPVYFTSL